MQGTSSYVQSPLVLAASAVAFSHLSGRLLSSRTAKIIPRMPRPHPAHGAQVTGRHLPYQARPDGPSCADTTAAWPPSTAAQVGRLWRPGRAYTTVICAGRRVTRMTAPTPAGSWFQSETGVKRRAGPAPPAPNVMAVRNVPWWGLFSSGVAPVLMVGGWMVATGLQPRSVDPMAETVSALAAVDAAERWVMTVTFLAVGVCYIATGLALRPAGAAGRLILVAGAGVGMLVAAFPQPADGGSLLHAIWASVGFCALTVWPAGAWRRGPGVPWALRPVVCAIAAAMLVLLLAWFAAEVVTGGGHAGLAERTLGVAQAVWPLTVVLSCRHLARAASAQPPAPPEPAAA